MLESINSKLENQLRKPNRLVLAPTRLGQRKYQPLLISRKVEKSKLHTSVLNTGFSPTRGLLIIGVPILPTFLEELE